MIPSQMLSDRPFGCTSQSLAWKSVCSRLECTYRVTVAGPMTSRSVSILLLVKVRTSVRASSALLSRAAGA